MRPIHTVQLEIQTARVADHFAAQIASPNRRRQRSAIRARHVLRILRHLVAAGDGSGRRFIGSTSDLGRLMSADWRFR